MILQPATAWQHQAAAYIQTDGRKVCVERSHVQFLVDRRLLCMLATTVIFVFPTLSEDDFNFLSEIQSAVSLDPFTV